MSQDIASFTDTKTLTKAKSSFSALRNEFVKIADSFSLDDKKIKTQFEKVQKQIDNTVKRQQAANKAAKEYSAFFGFTEKGKKHLGEKELETIEAKQRLIKAKDKYSSKKMGRDEFAIELEKYYQKIYELELKGQQITENKSNSQIEYRQNVSATAVEMQELVRLQDQLYSDEINSKIKAQADAEKQVAEEAKKLAQEQEEAKKRVKDAWATIGDTFKKAGTKFRQGAQAFASTLYIIRRIVSFLKALGKEITNFINASSSWIENLNLLEVVFGDVSKNAQKTKDWVSELAERFSMDKNAITQYISTFKQMANAMGQAAETGERMSEVLTQLGLDIASLRNVKTETAMSDLASAIAGQIKPVRKYGFDITSQSINALLKEAGVGGSVTDLTQSDKQLARTILLIRQSKDAWGDLGKTINTFANQQRVLNDQWETTKRLLGQLFIGTFQFGDSLEEAEQTAGIATKAIWHINGALIAFNEILEAVLPSADSVNGAIATLGEEGEEEIDELNDALNNSLASFDKFNVMSSGSNGGLLGGSLQGLFDKEALSYLEEFENRSKQIKSYAKQISNQILGKLLPEYKEFYEKYVKEHGGDGTGAFAAWVKDSKTAKDALNNLVGPIVKIQKALEDAFSKVDIVSVLKAAGELAVALIQLFTPIVTFLSDLINKLGVDGVLGLIKAIFWILVSIKGLQIVGGAVKGIKTIASALSTILAPALAGASTKLADLVNDFKVLTRGSLVTSEQMQIALSGIGKGFIVAAAGASMLVAGLSIYHSVANNLSESTKKILKVVAGVAGAIIGLATAIIVAAHAVKTMGMGWAGAIAKGVLFGAGAAMAVAGVTMGAGAMIANATKHAQGGYQTGGLFYAGESGAEWVGSQGNTSTIVNDKQMSDIMQQSVAMGVIQGNRMSNGAKAGSGDGKVAVVNLDGKKLFEVVQQNGRRVGKVFAEA